MTLFWKILPKSTLRENFGNMGSLMSTIGNVKTGKCMDTDNGVPESTGVVDMKDAVEQVINEVSTTEDSLEEEDPLYGTLLNPQMIETEAVTATPTKFREHSQKAASPKEDNPLDGMPCLKRQKRISECRYLEEIEAVPATLTNSCQFSQTNEDDPLHDMPLLKRQKITPECVDLCETEIKKEVLSNKSREWEIAKMLAYQTTIQNKLISKYLKEQFDLELEKFD